MTSLLTELGLTLQESTPNMNGQAQGDTSAAGRPAYRRPPCFACTLRAGRLFLRGHRFHGTVALHRAGGP